MLVDLFASYDFRAFVVLLCFLVLFLFLSTSLGLKNISLKMLTFSLKGKQSGRLLCPFSQQPKGLLEIFAAIPAFLSSAQILLPPLLTDSV